MNSLQCFGDYSLRDGYYAKFWECNICPCKDCCMATWGNLYVPLEVIRIIKYEKHGIIPYEVFRVAIYNRMVVDEHANGIDLFVASQPLTPTSPHLDIL